MRLLTFERDQVDRRQQSLTEFCIIIDFLVRSIKPLLGFVCLEILVGLFELGIEAFAVSQYER
jgi:hypothetical protein